MIKFFVNPVIREAENSQTFTQPQPEIPQEKKEFFSAKFKGGASIALWILLIVLTPITLFGVISQNSIPGDFLYPVKRSYESVALAFASTRPETKANYTSQLAQKRFDEASTLLLTRADTQGLQTFVEQVTVAQENIAVVTNVEEKAKLEKKLLVSISQYQENLSKVQDKIAPKTQRQITPSTTFNSQSNTRTNIQTQNNISNLNQPPAPTFPQNNTQTTVITSTPSQEQTVTITLSPTIYTPLITTTPVSAPTPTTTDKKKEDEISNEIDKTQQELDRVKNRVAQSSNSNTTSPSATGSRNSSENQVKKEDDDKKHEESNNEKKDNEKKRGRD